MQKKINFTIGLLATFMLLALATVSASALSKGDSTDQASQRTALAISSAQTQPNINAWEGGGLPPTRVPDRTLDSSSFLVADGGGLPPVKKPGQNPPQGFASLLDGGLPPVFLTLLG